MQSVSPMDSTRCSSLSWPQCNKGIFRWFDVLGLIRQDWADGLHREGRGCPCAAQASSTKHALCIHKRLRARSLLFRRIPLARVRRRKSTNTCDNNLDSIMKRLVGIGAFNRLSPFGHIDGNPDSIIVKRIDPIHFINHEPTQECIDDAPETLENFWRNALVVMQLLHAFRMSPQSGRKCSGFDFEQTCSRMPNFHRAN